MGGSEHGEGRSGAVSGGNHFTAALRKFELLEQTPRWAGWTKFRRWEEIMMNLRRGE